MKSFNDGGNAFKPGIESCSLLLGSIEFTHLSTESVKSRMSLPTANYANGLFGMKAPLAVGSFECKFFSDPDSGSSSASWLSIICDRHASFGLNSRHNGSDSRGGRYWQILAAIVAFIASGFSVAHAQNQIDSMTKECWEVEAHFTAYHKYIDEIDKLGEAIRDLWFKVRRAPIGCVDNKTLTDVNNLYSDFCGTFLQVDIEYSKTDDFMKVWNILESEAIAFANELKVKAVQGGRSAVIGLWMDHLKNILPQKLETTPVGAVVVTSLAGLGAGNASSTKTAAPTTFVMSMLMGMVIHGYSLIHDIVEERFLDPVHNGNSTIDERLAHRNTFCRVLRKHLTAYSWSVGEFVAINQSGNIIRRGRDMYNEAYGKKVLTHPASEQALEHLPRVLEFIKDPSIETCATIGAGYYLEQFYLYSIDILAKSRGYDPDKFDPDRTGRSAMAKTLSVATIASVQKVRNVVLPSFSPHYVRTADVQREAEKLKRQYLELQKKLNATKMDQYQDLHKKVNATVDVLTKSIME